MLCVAAISLSGWLLLRQARFCAWPRLVLSLRPCAYRRCLPLRTLTSLCRSAFPSQDSSSSSTLGISLRQGSLVWERLVVQPWLQYILFYCLSFLSFYLFPVPPSSVFSVPMDRRCVSGLVVDYIVVVDVSRVRISTAGRKLTVSCAWMTRTNREVWSRKFGDLK